MVFLFHSTVEGHAKTKSAAGLVTRRRSKAISTIQSTGIRIPEAGAQAYPIRWPISHYPVSAAVAGIIATELDMRGVVEALHVIMLHMSGNLAPSGIALREENGFRYLCLRRKKDVDQAWLRAPTLYLDAADISTIEIAKAWIPDLTLKVDARAKAPNMRGHAAGRQPNGLPQTHYSRE
jgi:hypothetical protein